MLTFSVPSSDLSHGGWILLQKIERCIPLRVTGSLCCSFDLDCKEWVFVTYPSTTQLKGTWRWSWRDLHVVSCDSSQELILFLDFLTVHIQYKDSRCFIFKDKSCSIKTPGTQVLINESSAFCSWRDYANFEQKFNISLIHNTIVLWLNLIFVRLCVQLCRVSYSLKRN